MTIEPTPTRHPIADQMYSVLLHQFMSGERGPGEPLNIGALSRELDVSQTPLREALARLEHTGLVQREALRGYRVAPMMTREEIDQLREARMLLEPRLARDAATRVTDDFRAALDLTLQEFDRAAQDADTASEGFNLYWRSDDRFHTLIAEQSGNAFLAMSYRALSGQIQRFRLFSKFGHTGARHAAPEHRAIFDAIVAGEPERAAQAMTAHIRGATDRLLGT
ncbi:MAG: GntR family transcriptional regulator [Beutenbergiaceae bacterium]